MRKYNKMREAKTRRSIGAGISTGYTRSRIHENTFHFVRLIAIIIAI